MPITASPPSTRRPLGRVRVRRAIAELHDLPGSFPTAEKALRLAVDPRTGTAQLQRVLSGDQAMAARILKLANSPYFGVISEVKTISMAINLIGYAKLRVLLRHILVSGLFDSLSADRPGSQQIREMSTAAGVACHRVSAASQCGDPEEMLNVGLLHNVGELALSWSFPDEYQQMLSLTDSMSPSAAQSQVFGVDSRQVGVWLAESWAFPRMFTYAVEHWPDPRQSLFDKPLRRCLCVVHIGVRLAWSLVQQVDSDRLDISEQILSELRLAPETIAETYVALPQEIDRMREATQ